MRCYQKLIVFFIIPVVICMGVAILIYVNCRSTVKYPVPRIEPEDCITNVLQVVESEN